MYMSASRDMYHPQYSLVVGSNAMSLEKFFTGDLLNLF